MAESDQTVEAKTLQWDEDLVCCAIANPTRRKLLALLAQGKPMSIDDLRKHVKGTVDGIRKHLEYLRRAGLVSLVARGQADARRRLYVMEQSVPVVETGTGRAIHFEFLTLNLC
jgi:predicted ArsR family transcriptional regulator